MARYKVTPDISVTLGDIGSLTGSTLESGVRQYLGVPYAEPPVDTREAAFEPPKPIAMIRPEMGAGTKQGNFPYNMSPIPQGMAGMCCCCTCGDACCLACCWCCFYECSLVPCCFKGESGDAAGKDMGLDVLRMNIWSPAAKDADHKPVIVWVHGGGDSGSARTDDPNSRSGEKLAEAQDVVVCTIDFRQGLFGSMDWGSGSDVPTNIELRDMVCALQFIQTHVGAFGGDKNSVTIFGESIGGRRICELVWCPAAKGLFHRAIATSPSSTDIANLSSAHAANKREAVNRYLGLPADATPTKAQLAAFPRKTLLHAHQAAKGGQCTLPRTKLFGASTEDKEWFGAAASVPWTRREIYKLPLGWLNMLTNAKGLRTCFDASTLDGSYMPTAVGGSPPPCEVPLVLLFTKDEFTAIRQVGVHTRHVVSKADAIERLEHLLPVRGTIDGTLRTRLATEYLDAYLTKVMPGAKLRTAYVAAMQDLWQYHACVTVCTAHSAALPGKTYLCSYVYDCDGETPHGADVSAAFGILPGVPVHKKGKDFEGVTRIYQEVIGAFARTGEPSTEAAPFTPFESMAPKMTLIDSAKSGDGCKVVETSSAKNEAYRALVAAIRDAESL